MGKWVCGVSWAEGVEFLGYSSGAWVRHRPYIHLLRSEGTYMWVRMKK